MSEYLKKNWSDLILVVILLVGLSVLSYPSLSNWWNQRHMSGAIANYDAALQDYTETDYSDAFAAAADYNARLAAVENAFREPELVEGYTDVLNVGGSGIMGHLAIPKIKCELPVYHGTDEGVLAVGVGHLEGTSLPVGGTGTHCVLSAHRGLPSATLFSNLDKLEVGDTFTLTVLNELLTYEVDLISIVLPTDIDVVQRVEGKDYCTLMTCTPYGINTHRLLVRGVRVENVIEKHINVTADATVVDPLIVAPVVALPVLLILLAALLFKYRKKR